MVNYKLFYKGILTAKQHAQILQLILNMGPGTYKIVKNEKGGIKLWQQS